MRLAALRMWSSSAFYYRFNAITSIFFDESNLSPFSFECWENNRLMRVPCTRFKINPKLVLRVGACFQSRLLYTSCHPKLNGKKVVLDPFLEFQFKLWGIYIFEIFYSNSIRRRT